MTVAECLQRFAEALELPEYDTAEYELDEADEIPNKTEAEKQALRAARVKLWEATRNLPNDY